MSRSTNTFPSYVRLDIDPSKNPPNYWDSSRVCENCETKWPTSHLFEISPCCQAKTRITSGDAPDMRWEDAVTGLLTARFERFYEEWNEDVTDEQLVFEEVKQTSEFDFEQAESQVSIKQ